MGVTTDFALSRGIQQYTIYQALSDTLRIYSELQVFTASFAPLLSASITEAQLACRDQRLSYGALSCSAVLRPVIDGVIAAEQNGTDMPRPGLAATGQPEAMQRGGPLQQRSNSWATEQTNGACCPRISFPQAVGSWPSVYSSHTNVLRSGRIVCKASDLFQAQPTPIGQAA